MASKKKGQSATEFLMTYGWAIVIMLAVVAVLYLLGVFRAETTLPNTCMLPAGFSCYGFKIDESGMLTLQVSQSTGNDVVLTGIGCTKNSTPATTELSPPVPLMNGFVADLSGQVLCTEADGSSIPEIGRYYKGSIYLEYVDEGSSLPHKIKGEIGYMVEGTAVPTVFPSPSPTVSPSPSPTPSPSPSPSPTPTEECGTCEYCDDGTCEACQPGHCLLTGCNSASTCGTPCDHCDSAGVCCLGDTPYCSSNVCVECLSNTDCSGGTPYCDAGDCVEYICNNNGTCDPSQGEDYINCPGDCEVPTCPAIGEIEITECPDLVSFSTQDNYVLCKDITDIKSSCIEFVAGAQGSTLDCHGHSLIHGTGEGGTAIIAAEGMTIYNCSVTGFGTGINAPDNTRIVGGYFNDNNMGIHISSSSKTVEFDDVTACGNTNTDLICSEMATGTAVFDTALDCSEVTWVANCAGETTGWFYGAVTGIGPLGANITVTNMTPGWSLSNTTDEGGNYVVGGLSAGTYNLFAVSHGYAPDDESGKEIVLGHGTEVNFALTCGSAQYSVLSSCNSNIPTGSYMLCSNVGVGTDDCFGLTNDGINFYGNGHSAGGMRITNRNDILVHGFGNIVGGTKGINFVGTGSNVRIENNTIAFEGASASYCPINFGAGQASVISGNKISYGKTAICTSSSVNTMVISNNRIENISENGLYVSSFSNVNVTGNYIRNASLSCIDSGTGTNDNVRIEGNFLRECMNGIKITGGGCSILSNEITDCGTGIFATIKGSSVTDNMISNSASYDILCQDTGGEITRSGNICSTVGMACSGCLTPPACDANACD